MTIQGRVYRVADIETLASAAEVPFVEPALVAEHLIRRIKSAHLHEARGQAQRHRRVIGPFTRREVMRAAADHVRDRLESAPATELQGSTDGVSGGEPEQATSKSVPLGHTYHRKANLFYTYRLYRLIRDERFEGGCADAAPARKNAYFAGAVRVAPLGITNVAITLMGMLPLLKPS